MTTAPTLVAVSIKTIQAQTLTSDTLTVQAGDVVTILCGDAGGSNESFTTPTTTLTPDATGIVLLQNHGAASNCAGGAWTFTVGTGGSGTVTSHLDQAGQYQVLAVFVERGAVAPTSGRSALGTGSSRTLAYTPSQADSSIHWMVLDWSAATVQSFTPTSSSHTTSTPGPSALPQSGRVVGQYTEYVGTLDDQTSTGSVSYGILGSGTGPFTILVVEVQGTAGSSGATVAGEVATATAAAQVPTVTADSTVAATVSTATATALAPTVSVDYTVSSVTATATADAQAPTVTADSTITAAVATATADAPAPAVTADSTVSAMTATATADAVAPSVSVDYTVSAVTATATADAAAPTVTSDAVIAPPVATATADAPAPSVSGGTSVPTFRDSGSAQGGSTVTSLTVTTPATVVAGDLGIVIVMAGAGSGTPTAPSGWSTTLASTLTGNGSGAVSVFTRNYVAGDADPTVVWGSAPGSGNNTAMLAVWYSGAINPTVNTPTTSTTASASWATGTLTTGSADHCILAIGAMKGGSGTFASTASWSPSATMRATRYATGAFYPSIVVGDFTKSTAGVTTDQTVTWDLSTATAMAFQIDLVPGSTGDASVSAVTATGTASAQAPTVTADSTVQGVVATATATALAPTVGVDFTAAPPVATATGAALAPTVTADSTITAVTATATADAFAPTVGTAGSVTVSPPAATATAGALAPTVVLPDATVSAPVATAVIEVLVPELSATGLVYTFRTPSYEEHYRYRREPLIVRIGFDTAYSVLKEDGFYRQVQFPSDEEIAAADIAYFGGRNYRLSSEEYDNLVAAGYGSYITVSLE